MSRIQAKAKIAVVAYDSLGDGLIYLMIAENLAKNNFEVTYYGDLLYSFSSWVVNVQLLPYPSVSPESVGKFSADWFYPRLLLKTTH